MAYAFTRLKTNAPDFAAAHGALRADADAALAPATVWGVFHGLFGIGSNELILVTYGDVGGVQDTVAGLPEVAGAETILIEPTVRPTEDAPRTREGLYVFRFFAVEHKDVDEIAALSFEAWKDFETADVYAAEPQGLFCQQDRSAPAGRMLLCTWYDGLNSWQASRTPPGQAREKFRRRQALTQGTVAYATRLVLRQP
ncbi:MAG: hypothetical protein F4X98_04765 [Gammaproteobacteria bacterium]|nr:hypothetical protein [Gammaproteobacteria bacterium]